MTFKHRKASERGGALQVVLIILGVLVLLILLAAVIAFWALKNYVKVEVERSGDTERVAIHTPIGDLEVSKADDIAKELRLPIYPGATPDDKSASVSLRGRFFEQEGGLDVVAAQFRVDAPFDDVDAWYKEHLGPDFKRQKGKLAEHDKVSGDQGNWNVNVEPGGDDVIYSQDTEGSLRGVMIGREAGKVTIGLFRIAQRRHQ